MIFSVGKVVGKRAQSYIAVGLQSAAAPMRSNLTISAKVTDAAHIGPGSSACRHLCNIGLIIVALF